MDDRAEVVNDTHRLSMHLWWSPVTTDWIVEAHVFNKGTGQHVWVAEQHFPKALGAERAVAAVTVRWTLYGLIGLYSLIEDSQSLWYQDAARPRALRGSSNGIRLPMTEESKEDPDQLAHADPGQRGDEHDETAG